MTAFPQDNWRNRLPGKNRFEDERKRAHSIFDIAYQVHSFLYHKAGQEKLPRLASQVVTFPNSSFSQLNWLETFYPLEVIQSTNVGTTVQVIKELIKSGAIAESGSSSSSSGESPTPTYISWSSSEDEKTVAAMEALHLGGIVDKSTTDSSILFPTFITTLDETSAQVEETPILLPFSSNLFPTPISSNDASDLTRKLNNWRTCLDGALRDLVSTTLENDVDVEHRVINVRVPVDKFSTWKSEIRQYLKQQSIVRSRQVLLSNKSPEYTTQNLLLLHAYALKNAHSEKHRRTVQSFLEQRVNSLEGYHREADKLIEFYRLLSNTDTLLGRLIFTQDLGYVSKIVGIGHWNDQIPHQVEIYYLRFVVKYGFDS